MNVTATVEADGAGFFHIILRFPDGREGALRGRASEAHTDLFYLADAACNATPTSVSVDSRGLYWNHRAHAETALAAVLNAAKVKP